jgi:hypothetical protein
VGCAVVQGIEVSFYEHAQHSSACYVMFLHAAGTTMSGPGGVVPVEGAELVNSGRQRQCS